ncbi:MAG TPA: TauD/TfdA family dioxygenase [Chromatiaceae bacterium]|jgi:alpha-ketoglutarate-dependent taurine dioxygenase|nr:MAG: hypothetical protein N838_20770 [Thiohalocapsa sp. PB-PSB1]QQO54289.1 MAG: TauD/TfdA family dioxygenase [Thiohalocapsa sp. PB-PSB1]HBG96882.1 TauD/TfdA family dioxygenase [Chromatiaceae bacterium]HCS90586.1 TauD/TfdA family dioxygenase [Chromatiaceae bacterium]
MNFSFLKPFGVVLESDYPNQSIFDLTPLQIEDLALVHKLTIFRGFQSLSKDALESFAGRMGNLLKWDFGHVLDLRLQCDPANHLFSNGRVELHWDGAFAEATPRFNLFQCQQENEHECQGGETIFVDTARLWNSLEPDKQNAWRDCVIDYQTEKKAHYGGAIRQNLVTEHPTTGETVLRFIEPYNEDNLGVNPVQTSVLGLDAEHQEPFLRDLVSRMYHDDVMYKHQWQQGDFMIVDNLSLLHGRTRFSKTQVTRHLQRVHIL